MFTGLLQPAHLLLLLGVALLVFGPAQLPALGASLGESIRAFRRGTGGEADPAPAPAPAPGAAPDPGEPDLAVRRETV